MMWEHIMKIKIWLAKFTKHENLKVQCIHDTPLWMITRQLARAALQHQTQKTRAAIARSD